MSSKRVGDGMRKRPPWYASSRQRQAANRPVEKRWGGLPSNPLITFGSLAVDEQITGLLLDKSEHGKQELQRLWHLRQRLAGRMVHGLNSAGDRPQERA